MGKIISPEPALLFVGTLYSRPGIFEQARDLLERNFSSILFVSSSMPWDYSSYYRDELGWPIFRRFIFFKDIVDPGALADVKLKTNSLEETLSVEGKRSINLDPGYLTLSRIVLASTKNYSHRIYLGKGIYGEVTLVYRENTYQPHLFTYRDYRDKSHIDVFMAARSKLKSMQC
ncbi:MAG: DUF4416 family protein [Nitrospirota bacterium]